MNKGAKLDAQEATIKAQGKDDGNVSKFKVVTDLIAAKTTEVEAHTDEATLLSKGALGVILFSLPAPAVPGRPVTSPVL